MNKFCVDTLAPAAVLRAHHGVLRDSALAVTSDAIAAANLILQKAREEADEMLRHANADATQRIECAEIETVERATRFLQMLQDMHENFLTRSQDMVVDLAQGLFDRLVMDLTPRKKLEAALKRVLREAPPRLITPLLRVHPDDMDLVPGVEWEVKADPSMARGLCRLEASNGQWCVDFNAGIAALKLGLSQAVAVSVVERCTVPQRLP